MRINSLLTTGLMIILFLMLLQGAFSWYRSERIWQQARGMYEHPFTVRRAIGNIKEDVLRMQLCIYDILNTDNEQEKQIALQKFGINKSDIFRQFEIIFKQYLGPRKDIENAYNSFQGWTAINEEAFQYLRMGSVTEAQNYIKSTGISSSHVTYMMDMIEKMSNFAQNRADKYYKDAENKRNELFLRFSISLLIIIIIYSVISYFLIRKIKIPLNNLTATTEKFGQGDLNARSDYVSSDEFGLLAGSFNKLAQTIQTELELSESRNKIANAMLLEKELRSFCSKLINELIQHTGSQTGAIFLLNNEKTRFEHFESTGLVTDKINGFSATFPEGEFGSALTTRQIQHIKNIPADARFVFNTVTGGIIPSEIITIPVLSGNEVVAVISLSSLHSYSPESLRLINEIHDTLCARINGMFWVEKIHELSDKLTHQNIELQQQKDELVRQSEELTEQNIELEVQKKQLDEASQMKSNFLSRMSHELRTPLNSMITLSGLLYRRLHNLINEEEYGFIEIIERNGRNLLSLINDILDISRIESGKEEIFASTFQISRLISDIVAIIEPQAKEKEIKLINQVQNDMPSICSDVTKCRHILQNIIANAVKFTNEGKVIISALYTDDHIHVSVSDTGIGIEKHEIPFIFDEFHQANDSASRKFGGTGLGLAIAHKYATLLNGHISVDSIPGKGSVFTVSLPFSVSGKEQVEPADEFQGHELKECWKEKTIMLVEDNEHAIILLRSILADKGCKVLIARNGREAIEQLGIETPDVMILDLMMPEVDGFTVLKEVRSKENTLSLPVIVLTAKNLTREELSFFKGNSVYQLLKKGDINQTELISIIEKIFLPAGCITRPIDDKILDQILNEKLYGIT